MKTPRLLSLFILSLLLLSFYSPLTKATSITDNTELVGTVNAYIVFNVTYASCTTYINVSTDATPDSSPNIQTYTDPTDLTNGEYYGSGSIQRYMLVRGLNSSTTYNYTINLNGTSDASGTFTTLPRYTNETGWGDEFIDTYLIQSSNNINLVQSTIVEYPTNPLITPVAQTDAEQISVIFQDNKFHYWIGSCYNTGQHVYYNYTTDYSNFSQTKVEVSPDIYAGEFGVDWDPINNNWIAISQRINIGPSYAERIYSFAPGNESSVSYMNISQDPGYEPTFVWFDSLGANDFVFTSIFHDSGRYGTSQFSVPNGINYSKWVMPNLEHQHRIYTKGMGFKSEGWFTSYYNHWATIRNQMYIGFINVLDADIATATDKEVYLIHSRDGYDWHVFDNTTAIIPASGTGWHGNYSTFGGFVEASTSGESYDLLYFIGSETHHEITPIQNSGLGLNMVRPMGLTFADPTAASAYLLTKTIEPWYTENFTVNGNFTASNKLNISILYENGTVIPNFAFSDFDTITTNSTTILPTWGSNTLDDVPYENFQINFSFDGANGQLFSYSIDGFGDPPNSPPVISNPNPANGTTGQPITFDWNVTVQDPNSDLMNITIECPGGCITQNWNNVANNSFLASLSGMSYNTNYTVYVNTTDSLLWTNETFWFFTKLNTAPSLPSNPNPANESIDNPLSFTWSINITDADGDTFNWTIECNNTQSNSSNDDTNGTKSVDLSGLSHNTTYTVYVNVTDGTDSISHWFTFNTSSILTTYIRITALTDRADLTPIWITVIGVVGFVILIALLFAVLNPLLNKRKY